MRTLIILCTILVMLSLEYIFELPYSKEYLEGRTDASEYPVNIVFVLMLLCIALDIYEAIVKYAKIKTK